MKEIDLLDSLFEKARNEPTEISLEQTLSSFDKSVVAGNSMSSMSKLLNLKNIVIMITASIIASTVIYLALPSNTEAPIKSEVKKEDPQTTVEQPTEMEIIIEKDTIYFEEKQTIQTVEKLAIRPIKNEFNTQYPEIKTTKFPWKKKQYKADNAKRYPVLTQDEIKENNKQKLKMIKAFKKKKNSVFVPSNFIGPDTNYRNWVQGFYICQTEVTNLEYRTFLFDLLIQGKKDAFDKAKPNQEEWVNYFSEKQNMEPMQNMYFSHPAFDEYPVVNVPPAGAKLYCEWLRKSVESKYGIKLDPIRIPTKSEWLLAASGSKKHNKFPWDLNSLTNESGCYLANFNSPNSDGSTFTAKVATYLPNSLGIYNMAVNVSELCIHHNSGRILSMGGSWNDSEEAMKIYNSEKPFIGNKGNPTVGFRYVQTYINPIFKKEISNQ